MLSVLGPIIAVLLMATAVTLSNLFNNVFPKISTSYFNIGLGVLIALIPALNRMIPPFNFEIFMLVLSPLLYFEGQTTTPNNISRNLPTILSVSGLLVLVTMLLVGGVLQLIPGISFGLGLVLAVVSAPTDATALETASAGVQLPEKDEQTLKYEGLFNDATGLVLLEIAVLVAQGARVSTTKGVIDFIRSAGGGVVFGILAGIVLIAVRQILVRLKYQISLPMTMIYLLTPYIVFLGAEVFEFSGIIAVVTTGIVGTTELKHIRLMSPRQTRWNMDLLSFLLELLNGAAFVSLGLLMTRMVKDSSSLANQWFVWIGAGFVLYIGTFVVRYLYRLLTAHSSHQSAMVFAIGGVHGAVNFALALSVAGYGLAHSMFEIIVMSEATFVILSMIVPPILFKHILPAREGGQLMDQEMAELKKAMVDDALMAPALDGVSEHVRQSVVQDVKSQLGRLRFNDLVDTWRQTSQIIRNLSAAEQLERRSTLLAVFRTERTYLEERRRDRPASNALIDELMSEVLIAESVIIDLRVS